MKKLISLLLSLLILVSSFSAMTISINATEVNDDNSQVLSENSGETQIYLADNYAEIYLDDTVQINVDVINAVGEIEFVSSDEKIATVNSDGMVTGISIGDANITVKNNGVEKVLTVNVKSPKMVIANKSLIAGETTTVKVEGQVGEAKFDSSNKKVASIDSTGKIKALRAGTSTIRVRTNGVSLASKIKVTEYLKINSKKLYVYKGKSYQLKVTGTKKTIKWTTSDKKVATVSKTGNVKAKKQGSATITATTGTKTVKCKVFVYKKTKEVQNRIKLKKYILKNGTETKDGYKMISGYTSTTVDEIKIECGVFYESKTDKLIFVSLFYFDDGNMIVNMPISVGNDDKAKVQCYMETTNKSSYFLSQKTISIKDYTINKSIKFKDKDSENCTKDGINTLSNSTLQISFKAWDKLIKKYGKSSMVKIGFKNWNK